MQEKHSDTKCEFCYKEGGLYNFSNECCWVRWLKKAFKPHAKAMLERYQVKHGRSEMLKLIERTKNDA